MLFIQKLNRRKAAKDHIQQKLLESTGSAVQPVCAVQSAESIDIETSDISSSRDDSAKFKRCCVSLKVASQKSACSCGSVSAERTGVGGVSNNAHDVSEKKKEFGEKVQAVPDDDFLQFTSQWPGLHGVKSCDPVVAESVSCQLDTVCSVSASNDVPLEQSHKLKCREVLTQQLSKTPDMHRQLVPNLHASRNLDSQAISSLTAGCLNVSQELQTSGTKNSDADPSNANGFDVNFCSLDDDLLAGFADNDGFSCDVQSLKTDVYKQDTSEGVCQIVESDSISRTDESGKFYTGDDITASVCQALSEIKIALAESIKSGGITDFTLPDFEFGEMICQKVNNEDSGLEKETEEGMAARDDGRGSSKLSSSQSPLLSLTDADWLTTHQQQFWYVTVNVKHILACCLVFKTMKN